ncbi:hypothetical protein [Streptomyces roseochromogenus]|nr:hypothetical protein [Streptomyces roseochromogenus]
MAETSLFDGENGVRRRSRQLLSLHLTRNLPGICDHRIAEYAYNIP